MTTQDEVSNGWHHWAFTKNASTGTMKIYLDGELWHSGTGNSRPIDFKDIQLGGSGDNSSFFYSGRIDEVRIWDVELDEAAIQEWKNRIIDSSHPNYSNLVTHLSFAEGQGTQTIGVSPNAVEADFQGAVEWHFDHGSDLFKQFLTSSIRPNITLSQGDYELNVSSVLYTEEVENTPNTVTVQEILPQSGTLENDVIAVASSELLWEAVDQPVYDPEGVLIDEISVETEGTITISDLQYFTRFPSKFEIMSFVTPYGINLDLGQNGKTWTFDVTDFAPILTGNKRMTVERGGQWMEDMDIRFEFIVGPPIREVLDIRQIWRAERAEYQNIQNNSRFEPRTFSLDPLAASFKIRSAITGHGQEGEFIPRQHFIDINGGANEFQWQVWKECADNPVYPQGGTWTFDRAGWCPGSPTDIQHFELGTLAVPGEDVTIDYGVLTATGQTNYIINNQLVTYGEYNFVLDCSIEEIIRPSSDVAHARINPMCSDPIVLIRNNGTETLTSATIEYGLADGDVLSFDWTGSLEFGEAEEVTLPVNDVNFWLSSQSTLFEAEISNPNQANDEFTGNNKFQSKFEAFDIYEGDLFFRLRTNNQPNETSFIIRDESGSVIYDVDNLDANTTYNIGLDLLPGCYTAEILDSDDDGLSYWVDAAAGSGYLRFYENNSLEKTFEPEFGKFISFDFHSTGSVGVEEREYSDIISVYPNPSQGMVNVKLESVPNMDVEIKVIDALGRVYYSQSAKTTEKGTYFETLNLEKLSSGWYIVQVLSNAKDYTQKIILE